MKNQAQLSPAKKAIFYMFGCICVLISILLAGEFIARIYLAVTRKPSYLQYESTLGWKMKPDLKMRYHELDVNYDIALNSLGFHDIEWDRNKRKEGVSIVFLGDSFTAEMQMKSSQTFVSRTQAYLNRIPGSAGNFHTMNFGVPGYSIDQEYILYKTSVRKFKPDIVVVCLFVGNDFQEVVSSMNYGTNSYKPYFKLLNGRLQLMNVPVPKAFNDHAGNARLRIASRFKRFLKKHTALYSLSTEFIRRRLGNLYALLNRKKIAGGIAQTPLGEAVSDYRDVFRMSSSRAWNESFDLYFTILNALKNQSEKDGSELVVVIIPIQFQIYASQWNRTFPPNERRIYSRNAINVRIAKKCHEMGIPVFDPLQPLTVYAMRRNSKPLYFKLEGHFTPKAAELVGRDIAGFIGGLLFAPNRIYPPGKNRTRP